MAEEYYIDLENRIIRTRCWGTLSDEDITQQQARLVGDARFEPTLSHLVDTSDVTEVKLSAQAIVQMGHSSLFDPAAKRAYVVTKDLIFGLARMYELYQNLRGPQNVRVFRDRDEALRWLGIKEATAA